MTSSCPLWSACAASRSCSFSSLLHPWSTSSSSELRVMKREAAMSNDTARPGGHPLARASVRCAIGQPTGAPARDASATAPASYSSCRVETFMSSPGARLPMSRASSDNPCAASVGPVAVFRSVTVYVAGCGAEVVRPLETRPGIRDHLMRSLFVQMLRKARFSLTAWRRRSALHSQSEYLRSTIELERERPPLALHRGWCLERERVGFVGIEKYAMRGPNIAVRSALLLGDA